MNNDEIVHEIFNLVNIINRYSNQFYNKYQSFIEEISNHNPFKASPKSANLVLTDISSRGNISI